MFITNERETTRGISEIHVIRDKETEYKENPMIDLNAKG